MTADAELAEPPSVSPDPGLAQRRDPPRMWVPVTVAVAVVVLLGGLTGWLGSQAYRSYHAQQQRDQFLQLGRQTALNLTTINHTEAEADVQRILDSATGPFHDDFQKRASAFVDVVKQAQSTTEGTVTAAGLESETADQAQVLVAVSVKTSSAGAPEQQPRAWRMRLTVQKVGDAAKIANVVFVP